MVLTQCPVIRVVRGPWQYLYTQDLFLTPTCGSFVIVLLHVTNIYWDSVTSKALSWMFRRT